MLYVAIWYVSIRHEGEGRTAEQFTACCYCLLEGNALSRERLQTRIVTKFEHTALWSSSESFQNFERKVDDDTPKDTLLTSHKS